LPVGVQFYSIVYSISKVYIVFTCANKSYLHNNNDNNNYNSCNQYTTTKNKISEDTGKV